MLIRVLCATIDAATVGLDISRRSLVTCHRRSVVCMFGTCEKHFGHSPALICLTISPPGCPRSLEPLGLCRLPGIPTPSPKVVVYSWKYSAIEDAGLWASRISSWFRQSVLATNVIVRALSCLGGSREQGGCCV